LFGMPHAVIGPRQSVVGIIGERLLIPIFGVVVAAKLAVGIAEQRLFAPAGGLDRASKGPLHGQEAIGGERLSRCRRGRRQ
jgi:hypothetical protein